jgi:hypothetical protein
VAVSSPQIDHCQQCKGTGFLLDQSYGECEPLAGWHCVQACDECRRWATDEQAARAAASATRSANYPRPLAYWPAVDSDEDGEYTPGDWAIFAPDMESGV